MGIENIKLWQWMIIGALIGLAMSYMWTANGSDAEGMTGGNIDEFERDVMFQDPRSGKPLITNIIIRPPEISFEGPVNVVTFKRLASDRKGGLWWLDQHVIARIPFKPLDQRFAGSDPNFTMEKFLAELARQYNFVSFRYAWWLEPNKAMAVGTLSGIVVIGVLWPMLLNLLIAGGFARKREPKIEAKKTSSWYGKSTPSQPEKPKVSAEDEQRLRDVTEAYAQNNSDISVDPLSPQTTTSPSPPRKLEGGELEKTISKAPEQDDIEVKGEYYPVLIHKKKSDADEKDAKE